MRRNQVQEGTKTVEIRLLGSDNPQVPTVPAPSGEGEPTSQANQQRKKTGKKHIPSVIGHEVLSVVHNDMELVELPS